jgi:hypothetical protein
MPQTTNQQRTQNKTTCLILPIRKDGGRRPLSEVEDMPRTTKLTNRTRHAPTQNTKQNHMPIKKEGGRRPPSKIQDMHPTTKLSKNTRLAPIDK